MTRTPAHHVTKPKGLKERPSEKKRAGRASVLAALPGTQREVIRRTKMAQSSVSRWLDDLHDAQEAHIGRWTRTRAKFAAVWVHGPGKHAVCDLVPYSETQRSRRATVRKVSDEETEAEERARKLAAIKVRRDPLVAAFFGAA